MDKAASDLLNSIIEGIKKKKGREIVSLNFSEIENSVSNCFVICHGDSKTQINAIVDSVEETVKQSMQEKPWHIEGKENAHWVLLDYVNIVVHVFQKEYRDFYNLEGLWADAEITELNEA